MRYLMVLFSLSLVLSTAMANVLAGDLLPGACRNQHNNQMMVSMNRHFKHMMAMNRIMMRQNCKGKNFKLNIRLMHEMNKTLRKMISMNNKMIQHDKALMNASSGNQKHDKASES